MANERFWTHERCPLCMVQEGRLHSRANQSSQSFNGCQKGKNVKNKKIDDVLKEGKVQRYAEVKMLILMQ